MKTKLYTLPMMLLFVCLSYISYEQANTTLSNLVSPTAVNQDLTPNANNTRNLGSAARSWRIVYIDSSIYLKDVLFIQNKGSQNAFVGEGAGNAITSGKNNSAFGYHALFSSKGYSGNSAFGSLALSKNAASNNSAFGYNALGVNTSGVSNTAVGGSALSKNTNGSNNTATGYQALLSNTGGYYNTAFGASALQNNGTGADVSADEGTQNTAIGAASMQLNTKGYFNTAVGASSLLSNSTGNFNTTVGGQAMVNNTTGSSNIAIGFTTLSSNSTGNFNTAVGGNTLYSNIAGDNNTAYGYNVLHNNTADNNTAIGASALYTNTTGHDNTAIGLEALHFNTTGFYNTAIGLDALLGNTKGALNVAVGYNALVYNTEGESNTAIGYAALVGNTTGDDNVALGDGVLQFNNTGNDNTAIGTGADVNAGNYTYSSAFGCFATITASNQIRIGSIVGNGIPSPDPTSIGGKVGWSTLSDGRVKKNIKENVPGLIFINKLKPITYTIDNDAINKIIQRPAIKDKDGNEIKPLVSNPANGTNAAIVYTGFAAQEVEKAAKSLNYDFSGVDAAKNDKDLYGLRYAEFVVPLVKAVQELDVKTQRIDELENEVKELKQMVQQLMQNKSINGSSSYLSQNIPNPSKGSTIIPFQIAKGSHSAMIQIIQTGSGKALKTIPVDVNATQVSFNINLLAAGSYMYVLIVDGKQADTKQMLLAK